MLTMSTLVPMTEFRGHLFDEEAIYPWSRIEEEFVRASRHGTKTILFYRHAATEYNDRNLISGQTDVDLSVEGAGQASSLQNVIPPGFDVVVCSRLKRTWQTMALALAGDFIISFYVDRRINEVSLGSLEGKRRRHLAAFAIGDIDYRPPHGESYRQAAQRAFSFLLDLMIAQYQRPLVFTHAGIMRILATLITPAASAQQMFSLNFTNVFSLELNISEIQLPRFWLE